MLMISTARVISTTGRGGAHISIMTNWAEPAKTDRFIASNWIQEMPFWAASMPRTLPYAATLAPTGRLASAPLRISSIILIRSL